jgi:hypothetical protein
MGYILGVPLQNGQVLGGQALVGPKNNNLEPAHFPVVLALGALQPDLLQHQLNVLGVAGELNQVQPPLNVHGEVDGPLLKVLPPRGEQVMVDVPHPGAQPDVENNQFYNNVEMNYMFAPEW